MQHLVCCTVYSEDEPVGIVVVPVPVVVDVIDPVDTVELLDVEEPVKGAVEADVPDTVDEVLPEDGISVEREVVLPVNGGVVVVVPVN